MPMEAVIFDLDGVICFTDHYHYLAWRSIADELGIPFDEVRNNRLRGVSRMESLEIVLEPYPGSLTAEEKAALAERKNDRYKALLAQMSPADLPAEVKTVLEALRAKGYRLAIGSSSKNAPLILERLGLGGYFDAVADGNGITRSKPDPQVFLKAAALLGAAPRRCIVVEDAVAGAAAGHSAGMRVACLGDAALQGAGDWNLGSISELLAIV